MATKAKGKVHTFKAWALVDKKTGVIIIQRWDVFVIYNSRADARERCSLCETVKRVRVTVEEE